MSADWSLLFDGKVEPSGLGRVTFGGVGGGGPAASGGDMRHKVRGGVQWMGA